jgi:hypothetical protein
MQNLAYLATIIIAIIVAIALYSLTPFIFWGALVGSVILALFEIL